MKCVIRISPIYFCLTSSLDDVIFGSLCVSGRIIVDQSLLHAEDSECLYGYKCKKTKQGGDTRYVSNGRNRKRVYMDNN